MGIVRSCWNFLKVQRSKLVAGIFAGLMAGVGSAIAFAAILGPQGVIHACYRSNGALFIIDNATQTL